MDKKLIKDTPIAGKIMEKLGDADNMHLLNVLNTELDINEIAEVDVEKVVEAICRAEGRTEWDVSRGKIAEAIAKAGILKWRKL